MKILYGSLGERVLEAAIFMGQTLASFMEDIWMVIKSTVYTRHNSQITNLYATYDTV